MAYVALITAAEARDSIPGLTGTGQDTLIDALVESASAILAQWCAFPRYSSSLPASLATQTYTRYYDGPDLDDTGVLSLGIWPVVSITSIHVDSNWDYGATTEISSSDYTLDADSGKIYLNPDGAGAFVSYKRAIKVVFTSGHGAATANIPEPIKQACRIMVRKLWDLRHIQGQASLSQSGTSISIVDSQIPMEAKILISPYALGGYIG